MKVFETEIGGRIYSFDIGKIAKQADGATYVRYGDSAVLATVVCKKEPETKKDFFPLFRYPALPFRSPKGVGGYTVSRIFY